MQTDRIDPSKLRLEEKVVDINRVSKVVKGGRRFSFTSLVIVGDGKGHVGAGWGKAQEIPEAIRKGIQAGEKSLVKVPLNGTTVTHEITGHHGAGRVLIMPASEGTGVIAGGPVRTVLELAGVKDVLTKNLGTTNAANMVYAAIDGLRRMKDPEQVAQLRGKEVSDLIGH